MSRSRRKHAIHFICCYPGNNVKYYKAARKHLRKLNKQHFQFLKSNYTPEVIDEKIMSYQNRHDKKYNDWDEPTDGHYIVPPIWNIYHDWYENRDEFIDWINKLKRK